MRRNVSVEEISDGRRYRAQDMVRIGTDGCRSCHDCCSMNPVIVLDPYDIWQLAAGPGLTLEAILNVTAELRLIDGLILPVLKMKAPPQPAEPAAGTDPLEDEGNGVCPYLNSAGRCEIHQSRPGICRLYPLGRAWEGDEFYYILQMNECTHCTGAKIKVKSWIGIRDLPAYESFCVRWHRLIARCHHLLENEDGRSRLRNQVCMYLLRQFYLKEWNGSEEFSGQFETRLREAFQDLGFSREE